MIDPTFWKGRKVFVTGHTGFKGSWLCIFLNYLEADVVGFALAPPTSPSMFESSRVEEIINLNIRGDIRDLSFLQKKIDETSPEIIIHMAAQSLVKQSYDNPVSTYSTNVMGTVNILEAARNSPSVKAVLNITTDKCYENNEWLLGYRESDPMGGHDPYSSSKGCAELISSAYRKSYLIDAGINLATARAGNVIGGGDWAANRLVPDAVRAFTKQQSLKIRNPLATRPWQHVLEPLSGYLLLCQQLIRNPGQFDQAWNFGPNDEDVKSVSTLADLMVNAWVDNSQWQLDEESHPHEARELKLDCSKAKAILKWQPIWPLEQIVSETIKWYKAWHDGQSMYEFSLKQIESYQKSCAKQ